MRRREFGRALENSYAALPSRFFSRVRPAAVARPQLIRFNTALASELDLQGEAGGDDWAALLCGNVLARGCDPIAMAYAGHQFGHFVPQLGDGRAILLGEVRDLNGERRDVQLKGAGRTPYSRNGDGRAALGPVLREYLVSEAMHALGVPATRSLAVVATGETVLRERPLPGAILTRVAAGHVRVGTFQYFAARGDQEALKLLADYVIERHYPELRPNANPYLDLLRAVVGRQARLVASWMHVGFIHGVMNTDNMAISGETIDFGPCAFIDGYDPMAVYSSIDHQGRYAYANQPVAAQWNLARLAETLLPLIDPVGERALEFATGVIGEFTQAFEDCWLAGARRKVGLFSQEDEDAALVRELLEAMRQNHADFTLTFRRLCEAAENATADAAVANLFSDAEAYHRWAQRWRSRLAREPHHGGERAAAMRRANPGVIPRNHRIEEVIVAAERGDLTPFAALDAVLSRPFEDTAASSAYAQAPRPDERVAQTFCGT